MKKIVILFLALFFTGAAIAAEESKITLTDGSVLKGEIVSLNNATYTIEGAAFGRMKVPAEKVVKIEAVKYASAITGMPLSEGTRNLDASQISTYTQNLMRDPKNAAIANELTKDPVLREMAKDPELMAAAEKGDVQSMLQNPKFLEMVDSPEVQKAVNEMKK